MQAQADVGRPVVARERRGLAQGWLVDVLDLHDPKALLSHLGGPQPQRHLGIGWVLFPATEEIGQGLALEQV